jgi:pyruvate,orthophosphate dikinase
MARPAVCGVGEVDLAPDGRSARIGDRTLREGDLLAVDGDRGLVATTAPELAAADTDERLTRLEAWQAEAPAPAPGTPPASTTTGASDV